MKIIVVLAVVAIVMVTTGAPLWQLQRWGSIQAYVRGYEDGLLAAGKEPGSASRRPPAAQASAAFQNEARRVAGPKRFDADLIAYTGLASWVDIFDRGPWRQPWRAVNRMHARGVRTIFLQTSTYGIKHAVFKPRTVGRFLEVAHRKNMKVVAWYVPSFAKQKKDYHRSRRAIRFRSPKGERFDSFAMDIEVDLVRSIKRRNHRLKALSRRVRDLVGPGYPLGAITPDPCCSRYWPQFPYREVRRHFDVFVPMGYWTFRAKGFERTKRYTSRNIKIIRRLTGDPDVPIHMIGGIANDVGPRDIRGFVKAIRKGGVIGASLYDFPITTERAWDALRHVATSAGRT